MLGAALTMVHRDGLTVSLDHISFEEVIRSAEVSRSAVYRRWPYKDLFFSDLVKRLAKDLTPPLLDDELRLVRQVVADHPDWFDTQERRGNLITELFRQLALLDFEALHGSAGWRTYISLHATFMSLTDGELRDHVQVALARSEQERTARIAKAWEQLAGIFGYRLRPELGASFETLATLLTATLHGLVIMSLATPELAAYRAQASPSGAAGPDEWSLAAMGVAGIATAFLEPDLEIEWNEERLAGVRQALSSWAQPKA